MRIFGFSFHIKREPGREPRLRVIEESLESHKEVINTLIDRLGIVEKKAEATRRKVYRDGEEPETPVDQPADPKPEPVHLGPGDPIPPGFQF